MRLAVILLLTFWMGPAFAQGLNLQTFQGKDPFTIEADKGIEWRQEEKIYIARGNALAKRGDFSVKADELKASYRASEGRTEVIKVEADGNVEIRNGPQHAFAEHGVYTIDDQRVRLTGKNLKLQMATDTITAEESIEYRQNESYAEAIGNATVIRQNNKLMAQKLVARFAPSKDKGGNPEIKTIEASGGVVIVTPQERVTAQSGTYSIATGQAVLKGGVTIHRDTNKLQGAMAEVNLNTGISRLLAGADGGRVRGVFSPQSKPGS